MAIDPLATDPLSFQPELGYEVDTSLQVDIYEELNAIFLDFNLNGAKGSHFWDIKKVFNRLWDAHVSIRLNDDSPASNYGLNIYPKRILQGKFKSGISDFRFDEAGRIQMSIVWIDDDDNAAEVSEIETISGKSAHDFIVDLANNPAIDFIGYESVGARVNKIISTFYLNEFPAQILSGSRPSDILPYSFEVNYASGESEMYYTSVFQTGTRALFFCDDTLSTCGFDRNELEQRLNAPGEFFDTFEDAVDLLYERLNITDTETEADNGSGRSLEQSHRRMQGTNRFGFDTVFSASRGQPIYYGVKVEEEYAILKVQDFTITPNGVFNIWRNVTLSAKERGVKKLIIDISGNPGGRIVAGNTLVACMFPEMSYELFEEQYDITYNELMLIWQTEVLPTLDSLVLEISSFFEQGLIDGIIDLYTPDILDTARALADYAFDICDDSCEISGFSGGCESKCDFIEYVLNNITAFETIPDTSGLGNLLESVYVALLEINPVTVLQIWDDPRIDPTVVRPVIRGGVEQNLTNAFEVFSPDLFDQVVTAASSLNHTFDQFVIVSNGVAGSTAEIFESMASQLWKNRNESLVTSSVFTAVYGGIIGETTMTSFPASVQGVHLEYPLVTQALLYLMESLSPSSTSLIPSIDTYTDVLPEPPYFTKTLPKMPVLNYYSTFMQPGALPMQYVLRKPDEHIPKIFTRVLMSDSGDLAELYEDTAKFFTA